MNEFPASKAYRLVEPGPVVLVSTAHRNKSNLMTLGFHMVVQHEPTLIGAIIGPWDHSFTALRVTKECVIAIPGVDLASEVVDIGNCSGTDVDKFAAFRLTPLPASDVKAPLVDECIANLECRVVDTRMVKRYNLFVLEVVRAWANSSRKEQRTFHHRGDGTFVVDGRTINLQERMVKWKQFQD